MSKLKDASFNKKVETSEDTLGGYKALDTGLYQASIKHAYLIESTNGAFGVVFKFLLDSKEEFQETIYITNKDKHNTYVDKKTGKVKFLPGYEMTNAITQLTVGKDIDEIDTDNKCLNIYNPEAGKEEPTYVDVFTELSDKKLQLGIIQVQEYKTKKVGDEYLPTDQVIYRNTLSKVFDEDGFTYKEREKEAEKAEFIQKWTEKHTAEYIQDKTKNVTPQVFGDDAKTEKKTGKSTTSLFN